MWSVCTQSKKEPEFENEGSDQAQSLFKISRQKTLSNWVDWSFDESNQQTTNSNQQTTNSNQQTTMKNEEKTRTENLVVENFLCCLVFEWKDSFWLQGEEKTNDMFWKNIASTAKNWNLKHSLHQAS